MQPYRNFIAGKWVPPAAGGYYQTRNPARPEEPLGQFPCSLAPDAEAGVAAATAAQPAWRATPGPQRGAILYRFADLLDSHRQEIARVITLEQGKALGEAMGEVARAAVEARYMAGEASRPLGQTFPSERAGFTCQTVREPIGVVAAISPWNFPVITPVRKIAPAIAFGNSVVFKPASLTPWSAIFVLEMLEKAGLPGGVVNLVMGAGSSLGDAIVNHPGVAGISFTGSTAVGLGIAERAARRNAAVQLEMGGKNPAIVFDYDDLDGAAREIVSAAFVCSGQRCTALSRVIVHEDQADGLVARILDHAGRIRVGDGMAEGTTMGPLVSRAQFDIVSDYVRRGREEGCLLLTGGVPLTDDPDRQGYYFAPTVFDGVRPESPLATDEIFGPVLPVIRVPDAATAIAVANATRYGLAASVFTTRMDLAHRLVDALMTGMVHINHGTASQAHVPFGGRKESGQGAFSIGPTARDFFTSVKAVYAKW